MKYNTVLLSDFYKQGHNRQQDESITKLVSYYTPRMTRIPDTEVTCFGVQAFIKEYLIEEFNENFFKQDINAIIRDYNNVIDSCFGLSATDSSKIVELWYLGYLPIEIKVIQEGSRVPIKTPMLEITNTDDRFAWVVNFIESMMSAYIWYPMLIANVGYNYRQIVNNWFDKTVDDNIDRSGAMSEFGFRGSKSIESGIHSGAAFLLSFSKTATIPSISFLSHYYNEPNLSKIGHGLPSYEHSICCSSIFILSEKILKKELPIPVGLDINVDDIKLIAEYYNIKNALTNIYPNGSFSYVSDSYDYWGVVEKLLPLLKNEINSRNGTFFVRGDSGNPINIVTETVPKLWDIFGGTINDKGFKVLDSHIRVVYGDSITQIRAEKIYSTLAEMGFAANNISLGVGSFSFQGIELSDKDGNCSLAPFTRDTFGAAVKATYCETVTIEGGKNVRKSIPIFKDPKTDSDNFKKSQKGCCVVDIDEDDGVIKYQDGLNFKDTFTPENLLTVVFRNGRMVKEYSLDEVRNKLHNNKF